MFFIECDIECTPQYELDTLFAAGRSRVFINTYDVQRRGLKVIHVYRGLHYKNTKEAALKPFIEALYALRSECKDVKLVLNVIYGKDGQTMPECYIEPQKKLPKGLSTNPLVVGIEEKDGTHYFKKLYDVDYKYNFIHIASLLLSKLKLEMHNLCIYCHDQHIPILYMSTDSLTIYKEDLPKLQHLIKPGLGNFKIEAEGENAIFIRPGLYYINDKKYGTVNVEHNEVERYCRENGISIRQLYERLFNGERIRGKTKEGMKWSLYG